MVRWISLGFSVFVLTLGVDTTPHPAQQRLSMRERREGFRETLGIASKVGEHTGIVEQPCSVLEVADGQGFRELKVDLGPLRAAPGPSGGSGEPLVGLGDSVAVAGACLTVAALEAAPAARCIYRGALAECHALGCPVHDAGDKW